MSPTNNIALYFGTFNPVHIGHMAMANFIVNEGPTQSLWFVVTPQNPLKPSTGLLPDHQRLELLRRAVGDDLRFRVSDVEFKLPKPNYTAYTLMKLTETYPQHRFWLVMGADNLQNFHKWKNTDYILNNHQILMLPRPGYNGGDWVNHPAVTTLNAPQLEVSATFIRQSIAKGNNIRHFMPEAAWQYLDEMNFFR
jgi:nicotinate-nucleotide adenylyltransferase